MKYLLDTDVVSQKSKAQPHPAVVSWLQQTSSEDLFLSVITIEEVRAGVEAMPIGHRRASVERWLESSLLVGFSGRILPIEVEIADLCGRMMVRARSQGHQLSLDDSLIAATAVRHRLVLATLNRKHFELLGVTLVDF